MRLELERIVAEELRMRSHLSEIKAQSLHILPCTCAESLYSVVDDMRLELERIVAEELRKSYINQVINLLFSYLKGFQARFVRPESGTIG
jgi:hypothetical protein